MRLRFYLWFINHWSKAGPTRLLIASYTCRAFLGSVWPSLVTSATHGMALQASSDKHCGPCDEKLVTGLGTPIRYKVTFCSRQEVEEANHSGTLL